MNITQGVSIGYWKVEGTSTWTEAEVKDLATRYDRFLTRYHPQVAQIRSVNPDAFIQCYRNFEAVYYADEPDATRTTPQAWLDAGATAEPPPAWNEWDDFVANDVPLHNEAGEYMISTGYNGSERMVDPMNQWYRDYLKTWIEWMIDFGYSAIFADVLRAFIPDAPWHYREAPMNPRTGELYTNDTWAADIRDMIDYIKGDIVIVSNGCPQADSEWGYTANNVNIDLLADKLDGQMIEGPWGWTEENFLSRSQAVYQRNLDLVKHFMKSDKLSDLTNPNIGNLMFSFVSHMLVIDPTAWVSLKYGSWHHTETKVWQDLCNADYGEPMEDYQVNGSVFSREYDNAIFKVDYSTREAVIEIKPQYKTESWNGFAMNIIDSLEAWEDALDKGDKWGFNVIRVVIRASTYNEDKLDSVLELIDAHGAKAVFDNHLLGQWADEDGLFGSQTMRDNWVTWVTRWNDDDRIIAWEIANEPFSNVWAPNITNELEVIEEYAYITDMIREIDPVRPCVWMTKYNVNPGTNMRDNIITTFHPYLYGDHATWAEIEPILTYRKLQMKTLMDWGFSAGWIGEIETKANITVPKDLNMRYVSEILSYGVEKGYGFNYWKYHLKWDDGQGWQDVNIQNSTHPYPTYPIDEISMGTGVTFFGAGWTQLSVDVDKRRDFQIFQDNGIKDITVVARWEHVETGVKGVYQTTYLNRYKRLTEIASEYDIDVHFNIHTWYTGNGNPDYAGNMINVFSDPFAREGWIEMVRHFVRTLDAPNVGSFQLFNECVNASWGVEAGLENWIDLFQETYNAARPLTTKPISARYASGTDTTFDDRIFDIWDYGAINCYLDQWAGHTQGNLERFVNKYKSRGKKVYITEMGLNTSNDITQDDEYKRVLPIYEEVGVDAVMNWWWSTGAGPDDNVGYQVRDRPAFDTLMGIQSVPELERPNVEWYGVGVDYDQIGTTDIQKMVANNLNVIRLAMAFESGSHHSLYDVDRMENILQRLDAVGLKAGLDLHNWQDHAGHFGSQLWIDKWTELANRYKNDDRVVFLELLNEPFTSTWHSSITGDGAGQYDGSDGAYDALVRCTDAVVGAGWTKAVVWSAPWFWNPFDRTWSPNDLAGTKYYGKVAIAFHEWYKQSETVAQRQSKVNVWANSYPVWCGEINAWHPTDGSITPEIQQWTYDMVEYFLDRGDGFNLWLHGRSSRQEAWDISIGVLENTGYLDTPPVIPTPPTLNGFSGSIDSLEGMDDIIAAIDKYGGNCYRIAFNPQWTQGTRPWEATSQHGPSGDVKIQHFLDNCDHYIIIDRSHMTDQDSNGELPYTGTATRSWNTVRQNVFDMLELYKDNPRVIVEIINEYWWSNMYVHCEQLVQDVRDAGYTNWIMNNKHNHAFDWDDHALENPNLDVYGQHWYFTDNSDYRLYTEAIKHMESAMSNGCIPICNTEIGPSHIGTQYWTQEQMDHVNNYLHWCNDQEQPIGNLIWMQRDADYQFKYEQLGFNPQWNEIGEIEMVQYENADAEAVILEIGKDETIIVFQPRTTLTVNPGEIVDIEIQTGERIRRPDQ